MNQQYWLMKSEPSVFSLDDLKACPKSTDSWDGIRNYQARNFMRDLMHIGDLVLFYHSNCDVPGVVGIAEVVSDPYPDHTAWDSQSQYYDPKSSKENPRWVMVDIQWKSAFLRCVSLQEMKINADLDGMKILQKGNRLSITPVEKKHFQIICKLGEK